jgi:hypothetical protein
MKGESFIAGAQAKNVSFTSQTLRNTVKDKFAIKILPFNAQ